LPSAPNTAVPVDYSDAALASISGGWERLYNAVRLTRQQMNVAPEGEAGNAFRERIAQAKSDFTDVMNDDFNTPKALAALQDFTRDVNTLLNGDAEVGLDVLNDIHALYTELGGGYSGHHSDGRRRSNRR
jgi:cysteinyl-tRNA synthetase